MKTEMKALIASVVVIALALTAVSGVTYSWWSDSENVEIGISTGSLGVEIVDNELTVDDEVQTIDTSETGISGGKQVSAKAEITNVSPGKLITITYDVKFTTTIDAKYRIGVETTQKWISVQDVVSEVGGYNTWKEFSANPDKSERTAEGTVTVRLLISSNADIEMGTPYDSAIILKNEIAQYAMPDITVDPEGPTDEVSITVTNADELFGLAGMVNSGELKGKKVTVQITKDIDISDREWNPLYLWGTVKEMTINGGDESSSKKITGMTVYTSENAGFVSKTSVPLTVSNLQFINPIVTTSSSSAGVIVGYQYNHTKVINVDIYGGEVKTTAEKGIYIGGLIGFSVQIPSEGAKATITDCNLENMTIMGFHSVGGLIGVTKKADCKDSVTVERTSVKNTLIYTATGGIGAHHIGAGIGGYDPIEDGEYTGTGNKFNSTISQLTIISTVDELSSFRDNVNNGDDYFGKIVMLGADIDLENEDWTPIGHVEYVDDETTVMVPFSGTFDGNNKTIYNLKIEGNDSNVGLFGCTTNGEIKNLTVENAKVSGYLEVGVVAGTPYTSKYTNITLKGQIQVDGYAYVGAVGGKNAYADWTNVTVDASETSYVKAISEGYRTYVGGVIGFMGEGKRTMTNLTSNIDVIGSTCDVGGITGIAHYGNTFINCSSSGDVTLINATDSGDEMEIGGIAGVWMNSEKGNVTFTSCKFTGTLKSSLNGNEVTDLSQNEITGNKYNRKSDLGNLIID